MPKNDGDLQLQRKKELNTIMTNLSSQEMRNAYSLNTEKFNTEEQRKYYSVQAASQESVQISEILDNSDLLQLTEEDKDALTVRQNRDENFLLINNEKFTGDSPLMDNIKQNISSYERDLRDWNDDVAYKKLSKISTPSVNGEAPEDTIVVSKLSIAERAQYALGKIDTIIGFCDQYLKRGRSFFFWRWGRYEAVRQAKERFVKERESMRRIAESDKLADGFSELKEEYNSAANLLEALRDESKLRKAAEKRKAERIRTKNSELKEKANKFKTDVDNTYSLEAAKVKEKFALDKNNMHRSAMMACVGLKTLSNGSDEDMFDDFENLKVDIKNCTEQQKKNKINTIEKIFQKVLEFDIEKCNITSLSDLFGPEAVKIRLLCELAQDADSFVNEYKELVKKEDPDVALNESQMNAVIAKRGALMQIAQWTYSVTNILNKDGALSVELERELTRPYESLLKEQDELEKKDSQNPRYGILSQLINIRANCVDDDGDDLYGIGLNAKNLFTNLMRQTGGRVNADPLLDDEKIALDHINKSLEKFDKENRSKKEEQRKQKEQEQIEKELKEMEERRKQIDKENEEADKKYEEGLKAFKEILEEDGENFDDYEKELEQDEINKEKELQKQKEEEELKKLEEEKKEAERLAKLEEEKKEAERKEKERLAKIEEEKKEAALKKNEETIWLKEVIAANKKKWDATEKNAKQKKLSKAKIEALKKQFAEKIVPFERYYKEKQSIKDYKERENRRVSKLEKERQAREKKYGKPGVYKNTMSVETKMKLAQTVNKESNALKSQMILLQDKVDINVAKKTDFTTVRALSAFVSENKVSNLESLIKKYTGAGLSGESEVTKSRFDFLDTITDSIMKKAPKDFDISSPEKMVAKAKEFETLSVQLESFRELLDKNAAYKKTLESRTTSDGKPMLDALEERLGLLGNVSRYYRIQKLILDDSAFQSYKDSKFSLKSDVKDDFQTMRLKSLLHMADYMKANINKIDESMEQEVRNVEFSRLFVPTEGLKLKLTQPEKNNNEMIAYLGTAKSEVDINKRFIEKFGTKNIYNKINEYKKNEMKGMLQEGMLTEAKTFDGSTHFGDQFDRLLYAFTNVFSFKQNEDDMVQMMKHMTVSHRKEYEGLKNDPEAMAYIESCFVDSAVKLQAYMYGAIRRVANGAGDKPFILHPRDLIMQDNIELRSTLMACASITNHFTEGNIPKLKAFMDKFNTSGKYPLNLDEMGLIGNAYSMVPYKMNSWFLLLYEDINNDNEILSVDTKKEIIKWYNDTHENKLGEKAVIKAEVLVQWMTLFRSEELQNGKYLDMKIEAMENKLAGAELASNTITDYYRQVDYLKSTNCNNSPDTEIDAYEKALKKKGYAKIGTADDPYLIKQFKKEYFDFTHDKKGNNMPGGMQTWLEQYVPEEEQEKFYKGTS